MSTEEQDQIHGRLLRERREARSRLAAMDAKVKEAAAALTRAGTALYNVTQGQGQRLAAMDAKVKEGQQLAAMDAKVKEAAAALTRAGTALYNVTQGPAWTDTTCRIVAEVPDTSDLIDLVKEFTEANRVLMDLNSQLERFRD